MRIQLFSERCSGSNFFESLLKANLPQVQFTDEYGFKHWLPTQEINANDNEVFFVLLVRSAFRWLPSFYAQPWHVDHELRKLSFSDFIRAEWRCVWDEEANITRDDPRYGTEMLHERHGDRPFKNVLEMRSYKHEHWLKIGNVTERFSIIQFEQLIADPSTTLSALCQKMSVQAPAKIREVNTYKGRPISLKRRTLQLATLGLLGKKKVRKHPPISAEDASFITDNLNWSVETSLGYSPTASFSPAS